MLYLKSKTLRLLFCISIRTSTVKRADEWWVQNMPCKTVYNDFTFIACEQYLTGNK